MPFFTLDKSKNVILSYLYGRTNMIKECLNSENEEIAPGLFSSDVADMAEKVFNWTDGNRPQTNSSGSGFLNILKNAKPDISASPIFIQKVTL
jgi:hypothetical protein